MSRKSLAAFILFMALAAAAAIFPWGRTLARKSDCPYKVYVILGFHANFYHSWRGDTPDEAGFGTDIRVVREIIRMLDEANAQGLDARGYWEGESLFTFEDIVPRHAPDIIDGIRRRVDAGLDEVMLAPYSNTLFSAVTEDEMRAVVRWSISNPWGSGARDLYGSYFPFVRPQEAMATTGQVPILLEEGVEGMVLAYSSYSFTAFTNFVPVLPPEQRYHFTRMRMQDGGPSMLLFPCVSAADVVNYTSLEKWMLKLRKLQESGKVSQDLVIHINFDADAETWIPMLPDSMSWFPNGGGLPEYIRYVNKYDWAEFTVPGEYLKGREPVGEVVIRQDVADGGWDGNYSWAEKYPSHMIWTELEKSRLYTRQAEALMEGAPTDLTDKARKLLYEGRDSSFFLRIRGLSTTHFGMSTPMVNEERQAVAERVVNGARAQAEKALRILARALPGECDNCGFLYSLRVKDARKPGKGAKTLQLLRAPVILDRLDQNLVLMRSMLDSGAANANRVPFSLVNVETMADGRIYAELMVPLRLGPGESQEFYLAQKAGTGKFSGREGPLEVLDNGRIEIRLDGESGVGSFKLDGKQIGGPRFISHFVTYATRKKPATYYSHGYQFEDLPSESWDGVERARLTTSIPFKTPHGEVEAGLKITFTLPKEAPWVIADVEVDYPYTVKEDMLHNIQQKLRRYLDLRWIEVAPFQLHPQLEANRDNPIKVWKHNWLDVTSWYALNYGQINPKNAELDSFNHQVTAGWVSVTDGEKGLLLAQSANELTSYAFCSMRLREDRGREQRLWLNPFGSYYGKQMDYSHLGGNGLGSDIGDLASSALRPNGPSFNGRKESFSLLIAPYAGDEPPAALQAEAESFFYPPAVIYLKTPAGVTATLESDVQKIIEESRLAEARKITGPLPSPLAFLVNPTEGAVDVVWDEPDDARIDGYEIDWRGEGEGAWNSVKPGPTNRHRVDGLVNGRSYEFRMRSLGPGVESEWTETLSCEVAPVEPGGLLGSVSGVTPGIIFKTLYYSMVHLLTTP